MGSAITRHLRDLGDGGFESHAEAVSKPGPGAGRTHTQPKTETATESQTSNHRPASELRTSTPTANTPVRVLNLDPRSPTAEIVRTPIEVSSKYSQTVSQDSPMTKVLPSRRSYLETDLDTLSTSETIKSTENGVKEQLPSLPLGLSSAHLMKLQFLGIDPRSPSSDVIRTPIQVGRSGQRGVSPIHFDDTLSVGSISSRDLFSNSACSSEFTRDCSDPSAFVSEIEDLSDKEDEDSVSGKEVPAELSDLILKEDISEQTSSLRKENIEEQAKSAHRLLVFQEVHYKTEMDGKASLATPEGAKKPTGGHSRTPLTPICNRNRTPNSILRVKQSQTIEKEMLTKAKIFSMEESKPTPSKVRSFGNNKENSLKGTPNNNENAPISSSKKRVLSQWDQDNSVVI